MARRLRKFVIPSIVTSLAVLGTLTLKTSVDELKPKSNASGALEMVIKKASGEDVYPVLEEVVDNKPLQPYVEETVGKYTDFYRSDDDEDTQKNSLIYYEKTYMPSTGILYSSDEIFDVYSVLSGEVSNVGEDNILGKYVEINHGNGIKTIYYSLSETNVTKGTKVEKGDVIGISGLNKLDGILSNNLIFETYIDGKLIDPEDFYNMDINKKE